MNIIEKVWAGFSRKVKPKSKVKRKSEKISHSLPRKIRRKILNKKAEANYKKAVKSFYDLNPHVDKDELEERFKSRFS